MKVVKLIGIIIVGLGCLYVASVMLVRYQESKTFVMKADDKIRDSLQKILEKRVDGKKVFSGVVRIESGDREFLWQASAGDFEEDKSYVAASITKMYTAAVVLRLCDDGKLALADSIDKYLAEDVLAGLHVYKGTEYGSQLTIEQLLFQTSGLPDYFEEKGKDGKSLMQKMMAVGDVDSSVGEAIELTKGLKPHFAPSEGKKAYYADINFDLLGLIIEKVSGLSLEQVYQEYIFEPLQLKETFLMTKDKNTEEYLNRMQPVYLLENKVTAPLYLASFPASGGIVSNAEEQMIFLKDFFQGELFSAKRLEDISSFRKIASPQMSGLDYGGGLMHSKLKAPIAVFFPQCTIIGHSGASSSFAFYCPQKDLYLTGTLNQMSNPGYPFFFMMQLLNEF